MSRSRSKILYEDGFRKGCTVNASVKEIIGLFFLIYIICWQVILLRRNKTTLTKGNLLYSHIQCREFLTANYAYH